MNSERHSLVLRSHLLRMTTLTQRAIDTSVKAYELNSVELCQQVRSTDAELRTLQHSIGDRGRTLLAAGTPVDSNASMACCTLRIYSTLRIMCTAAVEISQNTMAILESGHVTESPATEEMGKFVNSLLRLCSAALFEEEIRHAKRVLLIERGRRRFDPALYRAHDALPLWPGAHMNRELAIMMCLSQIAEQGYELAEAITLWLEGKGCLDSRRECAA